MATISPTFLPHQSFPSVPRRNSSCLPRLNRPKSFSIRAAKLPAGVELPKDEPRLTEPFLGFTRTAEVWNSRVCMIGLVGIFIAELIFNKGVLQMIGVEVGKGLDLPL
ncbi:light-harvesting complex-like protein OHP1, chloroplastic [Zingiber officinale]|uniref:Uncharacterized protein n=1 Tax=Zingiber officinale TaxID=94328 RepID=A0A8J5M5P0_ZINOF|nr:light-harvesting complex-like protein OHP1, chloroplastic [Zingiber officinale]KAG6534461.1 hypothetical protein ZIOFF_008348 [Zingiber officinale]